MKGWVIQREDEYWSGKTFGPSPKVYTKKGHLKNAVRQFKKITQ